MPWKVSCSGKLPGEALQIVGSQATEGSQGGLVVVDRWIAKLSQSQLPKKEKAINSIK